MKKELICVECPKGCSLDADIENGKVVSVSGNKCPRGEEYALSEIENPRRILTSSVLCEGLEIRMLPVRLKLIRIRLNRILTKASRIPIRPSRILIRCLNRSIKNRLRN